SEVVAKGGCGGRELATEVLASLEEPNGFQPAYPLEASLSEKIAAIATRVYGADGVEYSKEAEQALSNLTQLGYGGLPVCIAKTQNSLSDDPKLKGAPTGWRLTVREIRLFAGAGFVVAIAGQMLTMPGLPKEPAADKIDVLEDGTILGLF
ncbi:MAG TPA: formate--tetrahydrofolate ligase, partial [Bacillota bacterium]|nr:formate--tetrahydrofolate ligase [Bacillota bacterium]